MPLGGGNYGSSSSSNSQYKALEAIHSKPTIIIFDPASVSIVGPHFAPQQARASEHKIGWKKGLVFLLFCSFAWLAKEAGNLNIRALTTDDNSFTAFLKKCFFSVFPAAEQKFLFESSKKYQVMRKLTLDYGLIVDEKYSYLQPEKDLEIELKKVQNPLEKLREVRFNTLKQLTLAVEDGEEIDRKLEVNFLAQQISLLCIKLKNALKDDDQIKCPAEDQVGLYYKEVSERLESLKKELNEYLVEFNACIAQIKKKAAIAHVKGAQKLKIDLIIANFTKQYCGKQIETINEAIDKVVAPSQDEVRLALSMLYELGLLDIRKKLAEKIKENYLNQFENCFWGRHELGLCRSVMCIQNVLKGNSLVRKFISQKEILSRIEELENKKESLTDQIKSSETTGAIDGEIKNKKDELRILIGEIKNEEGELRILIEKIKKDYELQGFVSHTFYVSDKIFQDIKTYRKYAILDAQDQTGISVNQHIAIVSRNMDYVIAELKNFTPASGKKVDEVLQAISSSFKNSLIDGNHMLKASRGSGFMAPDRVLSEICKIVTSFIDDLALDEEGRLVAEADCIFLDYIQ